MRLNSVRAGLARRVEDWTESSAWAHCENQSNALLSSARPFPGRISDWSVWLKEGLSDEDMEHIRHLKRTGRPFGEPTFRVPVESLLGADPSAAQTRV